ncbi:hypothetical protein Btru_016039 [Bulinus truncatus]|nr:hypothetical protein Btru_016039 [Bulinus truncatus]
MDCLLVLVHSLWWSGGGGEKSNALSGELSFHVDNFSTNKNQECPFLLEVVDIHHEVICGIDYAIRGEEKTRGRGLGQIYVGAPRPHNKFHVSSGNCVHLVSGTYWSLGTMNDSRVGKTTPQSRAAESICSPSPLLLDPACSPPPSASSSSNLASTAPPPPASTSNSPLTPPPTPPTISSTCQMTFREAVQNGDTIELQRILEEREGKININLFDTEGQTALHHSCLQGNLELVKLLVRFGADVRLANRDGWNPLHIAAYGGHNDIFLFLMTVPCRRS